jgi:heptosyltransferase-2
MQRHRNMKICIIKLGADGDVLRTLPLAKALKKRHPEAEITWITKGDIASLLLGLPYVNKIHTLPYSSNERFDVLYNFDVEDEATSLALKIEAGKKYGFYSESNYPSAFNPGAEYYLNTFFDDSLKKENRKTYQEMMFEAAELPYGKEDYEINLSKEDINYALEFAKSRNMKIDRLIGIHMGASPRWPSKVWAEEKVKEFIAKAKAREYDILLFGGPNETGKHERLTEELKKDGIEIYRNNPSNTKKEFASLVYLCNAMICSDSLSLHVSLGLKKKTVGLFFCTAPWEVENYGILTKLVSPLFEDFFPERSDVYNEKLVNGISSDEVLRIIDKIVLQK